MEITIGFTTAAYRNAAWDEANKGNFSVAAELYEQAIKHYPQHDKSQLAIRDKGNLMNMVLFCRQQLKAVA